ncbi:MAG: hypothetical protein LIO90_02865 [Bacteroidales bacterium]|nr:hypothetical protein [Bacteroidales bacterium]
MSDFDENKAIAHIRSKIGPEVSKRYSDDDLLNVIDIIWDFYEENGLLEIDADEDIDETALLDDLIIYAKRMLKKDKGSKILPEDVAPIINAEIDYEQSLEES